MDLEGWTRDLLIFLVTAGIIVPVFYRARIGTVLAFLIAGVVLGPGGLGSLVADVPWLRHVTFADQARVEPFAELGVMFLLFTIGLELSIDRLWAMRRYVFGAGTAQILAATAVIAAVAVLFGVDLDAAVVFGLGLAFSSTAIVLQLLVTTRRLSTDSGQATLGILLMQDLMVVPGVILITILSGDGTSVGIALLRGVGLAAAAVAIIVVAGKFLLRPLLGLAASTGSREIIVAIAILVAVAAAAVTTAVGLSPALGALLAGILLGSSEYRHQIEVDIEPFKGLLLGLFFMSVGMSIDLSFVGDAIIGLVAAVIALLVVKGLVVYGVTRLLGLKSPGAIETAVLLAGAGEFAFILFTLARQEGLMSWVDLRFVTTVAAISMVLTPVLAPLGRRWATRSARATAPDSTSPTAAEAMSGHVIIGGFGRVGDMVAQSLELAGTKYVALDLNADRVAEARAAGRPVFFGDASRPEMLERVGASEAMAIVITADLAAEVERTLIAIRHAWPDAKVFARAHDPEHARKLMKLGASGAIPEAFEGSLSLARRVLLAVGVSDDVATDTTERLLENAVRVGGPTMNPAN